MAAPDERRNGVLVAGATGGLGPAVVRELLGDGRTVTATWLSEDGRRALEDELGGEPRLDLVRADLAQPEDAHGAVEAAGASLGAVVDLVGGYAGGRKVGEADPDEVDRMVALNLRPLFLLARAAMPVMAAAGAGAFVGVAARQALDPRGGDAAYAASKAGVLSLVRSLAAEYGNDGVRANAIVPSVIDTPANRRSMPGSDRSRWVAPAEIARVVSFLVSDASSATSGAAIPVYGRVR